MQKRRTSCSPEVAQCENATEDVHGCGFERGDATASTQPGETENTLYQRLEWLQVASTHLQNRGILNPLRRRLFEYDSKDIRQDQKIVSRCWKRRQDEPRTDLNSHDFFQEQTKQAPEQRYSKN